ncbi:MAG: hypothetical protein ACUVTD_01295 [Nitrososphaerales archaeon]
MGILEPIEYTARLLDVAPVEAVTDLKGMSWGLPEDKALFNVGANRTLFNG